jgi:hypothetical protein
MTQERFDFGRSDRIARAFRQVLRAVDDAVDAIGLDVAAGACDCAKSDLAKTLAGAEHRHLRVEWLMAIADASPDPFRTRIFDALLAWQGLSICVQKPLTPEEKNARYERMLVERFGPAGAELVREVNR